MRATASSTDYWYILTIDIPPLRVNWLQIANDIKAANGMSYNQQSLAIGKQWSTVERWLNDGSQPRFTDGHALLILHSKICGIELTQKRLEESKIIE